MPFISDERAELVRRELISDAKILGKTYKAKRSGYFLKNVDHTMVEDYLKEGWEEYGKPLKTKTRIRRSKSHDIKLEDDIWCQLYELGYRCLNANRSFFLPFGKQEAERKQIDVIAIDENSILIVECRSSVRPTKAKSFKTEFEALKVQLAGFRKTLQQLYPGSRRIKFLFSTRNIRLDADGEDHKRLVKLGAFHYNDNTYEYVSQLIKNYKSAAHYQVMGILFKGISISNEPISVPAVEGSMGGKTYYMFSIEPKLLLKMGFILHRTAANESESPTYQRLLIPSRLKGITGYINNGGFFANSLIVNFANNIKGLVFEPSPRGEDSDSRFGTLKIPNAFAIAYVIDGQHRLYGYAGSKYEANNTIPVVALLGLDSSEQLKMFMDINQNQKSVSASLRLTLEEDLYWSSDRADSRLKALRSAAIRELCSTAGRPLYGKIQIGEDRAPLSSKPFADALSKSLLIPNAKGNQFEESTVQFGVYDTTNHDHEEEMIRAKKSLVAFLNECFALVQQDYVALYERERFLIMSNRGVFAYISLIASLNRHEVESGRVNTRTAPQERYEAIKPYLNELLSSLQAMDEKAAEPLLAMRGSEVETKWLRSFQDLVQKSFPDYEPPELADWRQRQNVELQERGRSLGIGIERHLKATVLARLKVLYGDNWDLEIGNIKTKCQERADEEIQRVYKQGLGRIELDWTEMFTIVNYKDIIEKHWTSRPNEETNEYSSDGFPTFENEFSIDMKLGPFHSKSDKLKWMDVFNSYRNLWAHEGSKEKTLNQEEVQFLEVVHNQLVDLDAPNQTLLS